MKNNPFISNTFIQKWLDHFDVEKSMIRSNAINGPVFIKKRGRVYYNSGGNFTLQSYYQITPYSNKNLEKKILIIKNVPDYFKLLPSPIKPTLNINIVREYIGYLINLKEYSSVEDYLKDRLSTKKRSQLRSTIKKLEKSYQISYKMYHGEIDKNLYDFLLQSLKSMLEVNTQKKRRKNTRLVPEVFNFLKEVSYPMILEKNASLFVIYDYEKPIGISLNYNSKSILFGDTTGFDSSYSKYSVGIIMIIKQVEWCILNNYSTYDFSKGFLPYKEKWCNETYHFEHHIIFNHKDFKSLIIASILTYLLRLKQYLREHPIRAFLMNRFN